MTPTAPKRLLEREAEIAELTALLRAARSGTGGLALVEGPAGIGKTRLLEEASQVAEREGMAILGAGGAQLERDYPFGVVRQLLEPALVRAPADRRRRLLSGAAGPASAVLEASKLGHGTPLSGDLYPLLNGLFWLCSNLAEERPVMLTIDDAHDGDEQSLRWLAFLSRRLKEVPALIVIGARPAEPGMASPSLEKLRQEPDTRVLRPKPLHEKSARLVLKAVLGEDPEDEFTRACQKASGGNPFLLGELAKTLATERTAPTAEALERIHAARPVAIERSVLARLQRLPAQSMALAQAVALLGSDAELRRAGALTGLDGAALVEAADTLRAAGLLERDLPLRFLHPLFRTAVYGSVPAGRRADWHGSAARLLAAEGAEVERIAIHLLEAEPLADPWAVEALREAGRRALGRGAAESAVKLLSRAVEEPPPPEVRADALRELGAAEVRTGRGEGIDHLRRAFDQVDGFEAQAAVGRDLALALNTLGRTSDAVALLQRVLERLEQGSEPALLVEGDLLGMASLDLATLHLVRDRLEGRANGLRGESPGERIMLVHMASSHLLRGGHVEEAGRLAELALRGGRLLADQTADAPTFYTAVHVLIDAERFELVWAALDDAMADAGARGSVLGFAIASTQRSHAAHLCGSIDEAELHVHAALDAAREADWQVGMPHTVASLVDVLTERGAVDEADRVLEEAGMAGEVPELTLFDWLLFSRGRLRLAQGRIDEGLTDLFEVGERHKISGLKPIRSNWRAIAAPALARVGQRARAVALAEEELAFASAVAASRNQGMALRALGIASGNQEGIEHLRRGAQILERSPARVEYARTLVELGAALRRANRRSEAREPLRRGLDLAHRCGATALASLAREELAAAGGRPRRPLLSGLEALTPSERRIARMAADGLANPQIAQSLFLSRKTVEKHLGNAYRKLDIRSRAELREALIPEEDRKMSFTAAGARAASRSR